jgi:hypothetical protein
MGRALLLATALFFAVAAALTARADDELPGSVTVWGRDGSSQTLAITPTAPVALAFRDVPHLDLGVVVYERGIQIASVDGRGRVVADGQWPQFAWQIDTVNYSGSTVGGAGGQPLAFMNMQTNSLGGVQQAKLSYPAYNDPGSGLSGENTDYAITRAATATLARGLIVLPGRPVGTGDQAFNPNSYLESFLFEMFRGARLTVPWLPGTVAGIAEYQGRPMLTVILRGKAMVRHDERRAEVQLDGFVLIDLDSALPRYGEYNMVADFDQLETAPPGPIAMTVRTYIDHQ